MNKKARIFAIIFGAASLAWLIFIFANSMKNGQESGEMSGSVTEAINDVIHTVAPSVSVSHLFVRKSAHFCEFALFSLFLCFSFWFEIFGARAKRSLRAALTVSALAFGGSVLAASADETIQLFVDGRAGSVVDVCIDSAGALLAALAFFALLCWKGFKVKKDRENGKDHD